ncbi:MAG: peptidoglycan bridge formation glycyltransferase FemA/FemB family protein [Erysipelotrichaceae bacterium]|nr:peptidoglycan bridge formation glycyltransferase FemA/FemB family protein [Erysipelotrichaceae bacterium]
MSYRFANNLTVEEYDRFASSHPLYNIYQSSAWAVVKKEWNHRFVGIYDQNQLVLASLVLYRKLPLKYTLFYLPKGPLADFSDHALLDFFVKELRSFAKTCKAIQVKISPNIMLSSIPYKEVKKHPAIRQSPVIEEFKRLGFQHHGFTLDMYETAQPRYCATYYYPDNWPADYNNKATKNVAKALKKGVMLEVLDLHQLDIFADIMSYTEKRKNISLRNKEYYQRILQAYGQDAYMVVTKVDLARQLKLDRQNLQAFQQQLDQGVEAESKIKKLQDQIASLTREIAFINERLVTDGEVVYVSCLLAVKVGKTTEMLYAGMNENYRKFYATYLSYLEGIKWGHEQGCTRCDFGGVQGTLDDGLTEFKSFFDPHIEEYIGEFDLVINRPINYLFLKAVPVYKKVRRFLRGKKA